MVYTKITHLRTWGIEADAPRNRVLLKYRATPNSWVPVCDFPTFEAAATAVANSDTGLKDWDDLEHDRAIADLRLWIGTNCDFLGFVTGPRNTG